MKVVGEGNANILIDYGNANWLYRCCVRFKDSLKRNNEYSIENLQYIETSVKAFLGDLLCPMELKELPLKGLESILGRYVANLDDTKVIVFEMPNLKPRYLEKTAYADRFTQIYTSADSSCVVLELKPKWLYNPSAYCRNCSHSKLKGREHRYCYSKLNQDPLHLTELLAGAGDLPPKFERDLASYLARSTNVLAVLYAAQRELKHEALSRIESVADVTSSMSLAMTLRDVTCFIEWSSDGDQLGVNVVDVDLKPKEKFLHWRETQLRLDNLEDKCYH
ncbi:hypothetical protein HG536_0E02980 [Torulaspora globosa]|uniref:Inositol-pentakisphosphate 2-kinase n=1 Tax=Torulaspora globosa TaxID=48254 RepID=A0A7G3ZIQ1_9SACH|nr:uncharacterized protein HG536_0E02980 [Torulaspora globosa]QLL33387.1 hypothetical protein HG536_0E02980 [Torulaspora globosa]